ncbi:Tc5 transposase DNA-binding domain [Popillia japonica]|uniref:Tc5 transposase DNA-binding domain n=1 Tax=Popillia japonica TaxID=7064 RepID=A0AAW1NEU4_POPJA
MMKSSKNCKLNEAMFLWFTQQREKGAPLSGPIIQEKARKMFEKLGENASEFTATSTGWLDKWKTRYGIRQLNICGEKLSADRDAVDVFKGEKLSADRDAVDVFKTEFQAFTEGYIKDQVYNADETELNIKMLPQKSLASKQEKSASGHKMNKERITVLACSNASGEHRLPLLCILGFSNASGEHRLPLLCILGFIMNSFRK